MGASGVAGPAPRLSPWDGGLSLVGPLRVRECDEMLGATFWECHASLGCERDQPDPLVMGALPDAAGQSDDRAGIDFETTYRHEQLRLVRLAHLITGSNGVAEELVHDAFIAAWRRWDKISDPPGYLYRSVVNRSRSLLRRRAIESRLRDGHLSVVLPPEIDGVWGALSRIPPRRRTALVLRYYEDLSVAQIAKLMNARPGTVRSLIHRAHESLRKELGDD